MTVPRTCSHGVPFGRDDYCAGCELVSERSGLEWALVKAERHRKRIAEIEAASATPPQGVLGEGAPIVPPDAELGPGSTK